MNRKKECLKSYAALAEYKRGWIAGVMQYYRDQNAPGEYLRGYDDGRAAFLAADGMERSRLNLKPLSEEGKKWA